MRRIAIMLSLTAGLMLGLASSPAWAHQHRHVGGIETTVGWGDEPAFAGFKNSISFRAARPAPAYFAKNASGCENPYASSIGRR